MPATRSTASRRRPFAAAVLLLGREGAVELDAVRRHLDHTSGVRDTTASFPEYHAAVRTQPGRAWDDDEFLARTAAAGPQFEPGQGWAYSNTGYLLLRRLLDEHGGLAAFLPQLRLGEAPGGRGARMTSGRRSGAERAAPRRRRRRSRRLRPALGRAPDARRARRRSRRLLARPARGDARPADVRPDRLRGAGLRPALATGSA